MLLAASWLDAKAGAPAGYSSLAQVNGTHIGLLWEATTPDCVNIGRGRPPWPRGGFGGQGSSACETRGAGRRHGSPPEVPAPRARRPARAAGNWG